MATLETAAAPPADLARFLDPRTVAVIGVSENPAAPGVSLFHKIRQKVEAQGGRVFPVNPKAAELYGLRCYPAITAIPDEVDLGVIMVSDARAALEQCVAKGCRFVVIFTAGFAETGAAGAAREAELLRIARAGGVRLFGPNTNLNAFETLADAPGRKIALLTQSGNQGRPIVQGGEELGVGFSYWVPTGNETDLEFADFLEYFAGHDETAVVAAYVEGFKDVAKLARAADACARARKPIVVVKIGRSDAGSRMAQAHTGHLAGTDRVVDAFFRQHGIVRVEDLDELLETAALFARLARRPSGDRVCVYGVSGGTSALMSDLLGAYGVAQPELAAETQRRLREILPPYLTVRNPVDNGAAILRTGKGEAILDALADDPGTDLVVTPLAGALPGMTEILAREVVALNASGRKPCAVVWASRHADDPAFRTLVAGGVPLFRSFRGCARALAAYFAYQAFADAYRPAPPAAPAGPRHPIDGEPGRSGTLSEADGKRLLASYGIPVTAEEVAEGEAGACAAAERIGFPVALKIASPDIAHKSDAGLVRLALSSPDEVAGASRALLSRARASFPDARIDGVLVQEMVTGGDEVILGMKNDPQFGPVILFGLGGIFVEVIDDVVLRPLPLARRDAEAMVAEIRGRKLLEGARGRPPRDVPALVDALLGLAALAHDHGDRLAAIDVNPLVVLERGRGVKAVDALVVLRGG